MVYSLYPLSGIDRTYFFLPLESLSDLHGFSMGIPRFWVLGPISDRKLPLPFWSSCRQVGPPSLDYRARGPVLMTATDNTAVVVSIFPQQGGIHPHVPSCLVVVFYSMASISPNNSTHKSHSSNKRLVKFQGYSSIPNVRESLARGTKSVIFQILTGFELDKRPRENRTCMSKEGDNLDYYPQWGESD